MAQYLFLDTEIQVFIDRAQRDLFDEINQLSDTAILSRSNDEWLNHFIGTYTIIVPTLDVAKADRTYVDAQVPAYQVPNPNFDTQPGVPGRIHTLHIPYSGPEELFYYKPRIYQMNSAMAGTSNSEITIHAGGAWHTAKSIDEHFDGAIKTIEENLAKLRSDVAPFNQSLAGLINPRLAARRKSAEQTKATTEELKYPLRKRDNAPQTYKLSEKPKPLAPKLVQSPPRRKPNKSSLSLTQTIRRFCEYARACRL